LIDRRILAPLELRQTVYAAGSILPSPAAHGYAIVNGQHIDTTHWDLAWADGDAAMVSTLSDLRRYGQALATGDGLLTPQTQRQRLQFVPTTTPGLSSGLGIFRYASFLGHSGDLLGYNSVMVYSPSLHTTMIVLGTTSPLENTRHR
jgi:D-alanyl-D-alanine carboxypeptidase